MNASIFTAELYAILKAIEFIMSSNIRKAVILTDSLSSVVKLESCCELNIKENPFLLDIKKNLVAYSKKLPEGTIKLMWIRSHSGSIGNDRADALAKEATSSRPMNIRIPFTDFKESFYKEQKNNSNEYAVNGGKCFGIYYFKKFYVKKAKPWFCKNNWPRKYITTINRIRSDHTSLKESLARKNIISDPMCDCGEDIEDINHVIFDCPLREKGRQSFLNYLVKRRFTLPISYEEIVINPEFNIMKKFFAYCELNNIKI